MSFSNLGLNSSILKAVEEQGYTTPTPIQKQAIPVILEKKDVLAAAQTGTGKTAGFTLPLLEILSNKKREGKAVIKVLVLVPTRELALQVAENIGLYSKYLPIKSAVVFGGVGFNPQKATLRKGVDIVIATPGRLLDHMNQKTIDLSKVEFLVLDEADRMLDMGFIHDIKKVMTAIPKNRQTLLFSATFSKEIIALSQTLLNEPTLIEVAKKNSSSEQVKQVVHYVNQDTKRNLLSHLIRDGKWEQVLVFTRTKHGANKLAEFLNREFISADAIHGNKSQGARTRALADFKANKVKVLVATDIAARGIDIELLPHVVNFELPNVPEDYVHRIGRTGRAGNNGIAMSLVCSDESLFLKDIEKLIGKDIDVIDVDGYTVSSLGKPKPAKKKGSSQRKSSNRESSRNDRNDRSDRSKSRTRDSKDNKRFSDVKDEIRNKDNHKRNDKKSFDSRSEIRNKDNYKKRKENRFSDSTDEHKSRDDKKRNDKKFSNSRDESRNRDSKKRDEKENKHFKNAKSKYEGSSDWKKEKSQAPRPSKNIRNRRVTSDSKKK